MSNPTRTLAAVAAALCCLALCLSCGGPGGGAVIVIDTELCEVNDPGGAAEWAQMRVTINGDQSFCAVFEGVEVPPGCVVIGQGSFPLTLPVESASGEGTFPVQIELFARVGDTSPMVCETTELTLERDEVVWAYTVVRRQCGDTRVCRAGTLTVQPDWSSLDDVVADTDPIQCQEPTPGPAMPIQRVATGAAHACLIDADARLFCWGSNDTSQLGIRDVNVTRPRLVPLESGQLARDLALGRGHTCVLVEGARDEVRCWGLNDQHQLGRGGMPGDVDGTPISGLVSGLTDPVMIASGTDHSCALDGAGAVRCWGRNDEGQVTGTPGGTISVATTVPMPGGTPAIAVTAHGRVGAGHHSCALLEDSRVVCWGEGMNGQLGFEDMAEPNGPGEVTGLPGSIAQVAAGGLDTCATTGTGDILCWGNNAEPGTLGVPHTGGDVAVPMATAVSSPIQVLAPGVAAAGPALRTFQSGDQFHCMIATDGTVHCMGRDEGTGRLGARVTESVAPVALALPAALAGLSFQQIAVGDQFACALPSGAGNMPVCWGANSRGQRGTGSTIAEADPNQIELCD